MTIHAQESSVDATISSAELTPVSWHLAALEKAGIGLWEWDFTAGEGQGSRGLCKLLGLPDDACALGPDGLLSFVHPDDRNRYQQSIHGTLDGRSTHNLEYRVLLPDQSVRWLLDRAQLSLAENGEPAKIVGAVIDVTERKHEEIARRELAGKQADRTAKALALQETEHRLEAILDHAPAVVYVKDLDGTITLVKKAFLELFGVEREDVIGKLGTSLISEEDMRVIRTHDQLVVDQNAPLQFEEQVTVHGETRTYLSIKFPLTDAIGATYAVCGISTDITDRKLAEGILKDSSLDLHRAIDEINQFTYSISHNMRSPLRGVIGNVRFLREELGDRLDKAADERLGRMEASALTLGDLVDDLLSFIRLGRQEIRVEQLDLCNVAGRVISSLKKTQEGREVTFEMDAEMFVNGDSEFLTVLLTELLENACKYRKPGGKAHVQIGHTLNGFLVRDNGIGMETKYAAKIFLPFERLHRDVEYPGTGIGLANVKRIVDRHGGSISVESEPGKGSTFYVELPSR